MHAYVCNSISRCVALRVCAINAKSIGDLKCACVAAVFVVYFISAYVKDKKHEIYVRQTNEYLHTFL